MGILESYLGRWISATRKYACTYCTYFIRLDLFVEDTMVLPLQKLKYEWLKARTPDKLQIDFSGISCIFHHGVTELLNNVRATNVNEKPNTIVLLLFSDQLDNAHFVGEKYVFWRNCKKNIKEFPDASK